MLSEESMESDLWNIEDVRRRCDEIIRQQHLDCIAQCISKAELLMSDYATGRSLGDADIESSGWRLALIELMVAMQIYNSIKKVKV